MSVTWKDEGQHYGYRVARRVGTEVVVKYFEVATAAELRLLKKASPDLRELLEKKIKVAREVAHRDALAFDEELVAQQRDLLTPRLKGAFRKPDRPEEEVGPVRIFPIRELDGFALQFAPGSRPRWSFIVGHVNPDGTTPGAQHFGFERSNVASRLEQSLQAWGSGKDKEIREEAGATLRLEVLARFLKSTDPHF